MVRRPDERIPVEPLSEPRWARIERSLEARLSDKEGSFDDEPLARRRPWWRSAPALLVAGAAAAAAGALAARPLFHDGSASVVSHIETGAAGSHLRVGGASIDVAPNTELQVSGDEERGVLVVLDRGEVGCEVAPRLDHPAFLVQAGDVRVRVVGTRFTVKRQQADVTVDVTRGVVEVEAFGEKDRVPAGSHWPSDASTAPAPAVEPPPSAPPPLVPQVAASALHPSVPRPASARTPSSISGGNEPAPASDPAPSSASFSAPASAPSTAIAEPRAGSSAQARYEAAARLEARDPAAALASYRQLAGEGNDTWSANALYAGARLQADRGARREAQSMAQQYLARFPHGPNAADAKDLLNHAGSATP